MADDHSGLLGDEDDEQLNASNGKAKITRKRYTREMIVTLLEIVDEVLPYGNRDWETVAAKYNHIFNDDRDYVSVRKKFFDLVPRGSIPPQLQTAENLRADLVHKRITLRQHGGGMPPPTPPDVLVALYTNSNLPLPASLRAHAAATPSGGGGGSAGHSTSAPSPESATLLGKRKTTTLAADGGDGGSVGGSIVAPFASAASSSNLSHLANGGGGGGGGAAGGAYGGAAMTPYAAFVATTTTTAAATSDKVKNEDYAQYLGNPAAYRPSPQGAGLTAILYKILHEPLKPAPTTLPPAHQQKLDSLQAQAAPRSLAALAQRRAQQGGAVLSELGQLEDALLDVFNAHDKLALYFAARGVAAASASDAEAADETKTPAEAAESLDAARSAELRDIEAVYQASLGVARAVSQWLETHRPQFKRLKLTPHSLQQMYERRTCGGALGGAASAFSASQAVAVGCAAAQAAADASVAASQDEPSTKAAAKPTAEEDEDGDGLDEAEDDEDEDGAADDFEDLYASSGHTPRTAGAATAMDAE